jgi:UDP-glucose 4-epimerase
VTGGEGFLGSNLAIRLTGLGARVTIVDGAIGGCGANPVNLEGWTNGIRLIRADIAEVERFAAPLAEARIVFNLAGEISHVRSMREPARDLRLNVACQMEFLEGCRRLNPGVRIVYAGTRQVYGNPVRLPVDESHPAAPIDYNGVHKQAAAETHLMLTRAGLLDAVVLRLTNVYGPRLALGVEGQGFLGVFFRRALLGLPVQVYGDGKTLRDPVYVDDAVEAFLLAGVAAGPGDRLFLLSGPEALSLEEIARVICEISGRSRIEYRPFPDELRSIGLGSYYGDSRRIRAALGWEPKVRFREGVRRTLDYFAPLLDRYLDPASFPTNSARDDERG